MKLDTSSSKLCLLFGISSAQDVFQAIMSEMFEDIEGVEVIVDDILVWGATVEEHNARLEQVLKRAQQRNLKLNKDKSQIQMKEISYIGHTLSQDGIKPDPRKVQAIMKLKEPENREDLQRFLGMTTYLSLPNLSPLKDTTRERLRMALGTPTSHSICSTETVHHKCPCA